VVNVFYFTGYYTRVVAIRKLIRQFIENGGKQILSLGAGYDTTYWVLKVTTIHQAHTHTHMNF
jgi:O-methyltransferase involved in polyketide biosynthesis